MAVTSNGSTATWGGSTLTGLQSIQTQETGTEIDAADLDSTRKDTEGGLIDITVTLGFNTTGHGIAYNDTGDFAAAFQDGGSKSFSDMRVSSVDNNAQKDSPLASTVTLKPTPAAPAP